VFTQLSVVWLESGLANTCANVAEGGDELGHEAEAGSWG